MLTLADCRALDAADPLRPLRDLFSLPAGIVYLDGNSLGALPKSTATRVAEVVSQEWGEGLIRSWNSAGWINLPQALGDRIARLIGAAPGEVVVADSTSVNLYKVLSAAMAISRHDAPGRNAVLSERSNFPTDLYIAQSLCEQQGFELRLVEAAELPAAIKRDVAALMLTHVNYRTGALLDMASITAHAHAAGALAIWDLSHSAGAVPVDLNTANADFAVGCGYKYLNGGPGAPAFVWANTRHLARQDSPIRQPLSGWLGHAAPFEFATAYAPAAGIARFQCGTPPVLSLAALDCGLGTFEAAEGLGGMGAIRQKSLALTDLFIALVEQLCPGNGLAIETPLPHQLRGSQVSLSFAAAPAGAAPNTYAVMQALISRGVIGDFRAGDGDTQKDLLRFGFTPLYVGYEDVWQAVGHLKQVLDTRQWAEPEFARKHAVT